MVDEVIQQNVLDTFVSGLSDEVINRSEGDLLSQEMISQYVAQMMQQTEADLQRYLDFAANYEGDRSSLQAEVANIRTNLLTMYQGLQTALDNFTLSNNTRYNDLAADVAKYLQILSDVKLDSSNITLDNGDLRYGAWTILSQARQWDLDIINRLNSLEVNNAALVETSMDEVKDLIRSDEETISLVIAELSNSPIIQALDAKLNSNLADVDSLFARMDAESIAQAQAIIDSAVQVKAEAMASISVLETTILEETDVRTQELSILAGHINEGLALETQERLADIALLNDGLTAEINLLKDADTATLTALNNYKASNDNALANIQQSLNANVTATTANASSITALDTRLTINETNTANAISKADTALTENTAQASQINAINVALGSKADVTAFNTLQAEVTTIDGKVTTNTNSLTSLSGRVTTVENDLTTKANASALNNYYTKTEADTATAGQISSYDASLVVGGSNLQAGTKTGLFTFYTGGTVSEYSSTFRTVVYKLTKTGTGVQGLAATSANRSVSLKKDKKYIVSCYIRGNAPITYAFMMKAKADSGNLGMVINTSGMNETTYVKATFTFTAQRDCNDAYLMMYNNGAAIGTWFEVAEITVQEGTKFTDWSPSPLDVDAALAVNASAISGIDSRVTIAEGVITSQGTSITNLQNSLTTTNNAVATKADASALTALDNRVTTAEGGITSNANNLTKLEANLNAAAEGIKQLAGIDASNWVFTAQSEYSIVDEATAATGKVLRSGNNSGNDNTWARSAMVVPFDPTKLYRLRYRLRRVTGTGTVYLGLAALDKTKTQYVSSSNVVTSSLSASHYAYSGAPTLGTWYEGEYYFKGRGDTVASGSGTPTDPRKLAAQAAYLSVMFITNYPSNTGEVDIDYIILEDAEAIAKADANASAITATNATVSSIDGRVTTNTNAITSLNTTVAGKADASALNNYYTKTAADSAIAGQIASFNSNLVIGGTNLFVMSDTATGYVNTATGAITTSTAAHKSMQSLVNTNGNTGLVYQVWNPNKITNTNTNRIAFFDVNQAFISYVNIPTLNGTSYQTAQITIPANAVFMRLGAICGPNGSVDSAVKVKYEFGSKATDWAKADGDWDSQLSGKLDASAITSYYTKTEADTAAAGQISSFDASMQIGGSNLLAGTKADGFFPWNSGSLVTQFQGQFRTSTYRCEKAVTTGAGIQPLGVNRTITLKAGQKYILTAWVRGTAPLNYTYFMNSTATGSNTGVSVSAPGYNDTTFVKMTAVFTATVDRTGAYILIGNNGGAVGLWFEVAEIMVQEGTKATDWSLSALELDTAISNNANAITTINTTVSNLDGQVTANASSITQLKSSIDGDNGANIFPDPLYADPSLWNGSVKSSFVQKPANSDVSVTTAYAYPGTTAAISITGGTANGFAGDLGLAMKVTPETKYSISGKLRRYVTSAKGVIQVYAYYLDAAGTEVGTATLIKSEAVSAGIYTSYAGEVTTPINCTLLRLRFRLQHDATGSFYAGYMSFPGITVERIAQSVSTTLTESATTLNGIMSIKTVTIDNNGVMSGYGLISQLKDGQVTSGFGVNADQFYVGAPAGGKKPFIVTTTTTTINGVSYPAGTWIDTAFIANATIGGAKIQNASIDTAQITDGAITNAKIENLAVTGAKIANATIGTAQIANLAVTGAKIANATIGSAQIADAAITSAKIGNAQITGAKIGDLQVDTLKIANNAVTVPLYIEDTSVINETAVTTSWSAFSTVTLTGIKSGERVFVFLKGEPQTDTTAPSSMLIGGSITGNYFDFGISVAGIVKTLLRGEIIGDPYNGGQWPKIYLKPGELFSHSFVAAVDNPVISLVFRASHNNSGGYRKNGRIIYTVLGVRK